MSADPCELEAAAQKEDDAIAKAIYTVGAALVHKLAEIAARLKQLEPKPR